MIRIDTPNGPIHINVCYPVIKYKGHPNVLNDQYSETPAVSVYAGAGEMSYEFWKASVDIAAPDFGDLLSAVKKNVQSAITLLKEPRSPDDS
jgi:hypothetical protein